MASSMLPLHGTINKSFIDSSMRLLKVIQAGLNSDITTSRL